MAAVAVGVTPGRAPTLYDVARVAGVSRQTVSNAMNAPDRLHAHTLARVRDAIDGLGYVPNRTARSLRHQTSRLIGYRVMPFDPVLTSPILDRFLHALTDSARREGYLVVLFTPADEQDELSTYAELRRTGAVDGFVLSDIERRDERAQFLLELGAPFVSFGKTGLRRPHPWVDVDGAAGTAAAVQYLAGRGHERIAFIGWPAGSRPGDDRLAGWRRAMTDAGLAFPSSLVARAAHGVEEGARAAAHLLDRRQPPTAIVCACDTFAMGCLAECRSRGVTVGDDVAVVGFDDSPAAALVSPPLTTVSQPVEEVARTIVRMLTTRLAGAEGGATHRLIEPTLVVRESA
ncbi:MAG: LacI family DNA-binding transcriptional regulator [Acidimicrobiales bacterium]